MITGINRSNFLNQIDPDLYSKIYLFQLITVFIKMDLVTLQPIALRSSSCKFLLDKAVRNVLFDPVWVIIAARS